MSPLVSALLATTLIDLVELGSLVVVAKKFWNSRTEVRLFSFAAGVLLATVFLDLLPEAFDRSHNPTILLRAILMAMIVLFFTERLLQRDHSHGQHAEGHEHHDHQAAGRYFIVIGDGLHSAIDGLAIATSFLLSPAAGVATTLAVLAHEVPHQIGDYSVLVRRGVGKRKALVVNFTSAIAALSGVALTFAFRSFVEANLGVLIASTSGMLLYIAAVNLLPELLHGTLKGRALYGVPFIVGLVLIAALTQLIPA